MLTGYRKKLVKESISYFIDETGLSADNFILLIQRNSRKNINIEDLDYNSWLALKCFELFKENDITLADCLEFRNLASQLKMEKCGINVTDVWKKEILNVIEKSNIDGYTLFDVSDKDSCFSYQNKEYFVMEENKNEEVNFYNTFDFGEDNPLFFRILPNEVRNSIIYNTPLFINLNVYLDKNKKIDNIFENMRLYGYGKKYYKDVFYAGLFRIMKLCREKGLTEVKIGLLSNLNMFYEKEESIEFYKEFKSMFKFNSGICFNPKAVGVKEKVDFLGYTIWELKSENDKDVPVVLEEKISQNSDSIVSGCMRLIRGQRESLYDWVDKSVYHTGETVEVPKYLNIQTQSEEKIERYKNVLGYQQNTKNLLRSVKKVGIYNVPIGEYTEITEENFVKSVISFTVRSCLLDDIEYTIKPVFLNVPDMTIEGFKKWLADAIIYFTFSPLNMSKSYREKNFEIGNYFFPLTQEEVRQYIRDKNILNDLETHKPCNTEFLKILGDSCINSSKIGKEFFNYCMSLMLKSLDKDIREDVGYKDSLVAWDAGFYQVREISTIFSPVVEEKYNYLLSKLKDSLSAGIYKYGFIIKNN